MPQLIDLDTLGTSLDLSVYGASDDVQLDALAQELAELVCPSSALRVWPVVDHALPAHSPRVSLLDAAGPYEGPYELPDAYSFADATRLEADLAQLLADLETEARRARRGRWINQVMALPA